PFARGASQAVTIRQEPNSPRRDRVPELTEADRARMLLEVKSRLESPAGDGVALVSHQEQPKQRAPVRSRPVSRKPRNPLLDDVASAACFSPDDEDSADGPPRDVRAAAGARSVRHAARHLLDDEDAGAPPDSAEPGPVRSWQKRTAPAPATHVLDDASR